MACETIVSPPRTLPSRVVNADKRALTSSETSRRKPTESTIANDTNRCRMKPHTPWPGFGSTPQILFSEVCSCPTTPPAPKSKAMTPNTVEIIPAWGFSPALWIMPWIACALSCPTRPRMVCTIWFCAACSPKTKPAMEIAMIKSGAREKSV